MVRGRFIWHDAVEGGEDDRSPTVAKGAKESAHLPPGGRSRRVLVRNDRPVSDLRRRLRHGRTSHHQRADRRRKHPARLRAALQCPTFDTNNDGAVSVNELVLGVNNALAGCPETCPLEPGVYTITQVEGGTLGVTRFPRSTSLPAARSWRTSAPETPTVCTIPWCRIQAASAHRRSASLPPATRSTSSRRGAASAASIRTAGPTSRSPSSVTRATPPRPATYRTRRARRGADTSIRVDVTVGDGSPDTCTGGGIANAILTVPLLMTVWIPAIAPAPTQTVSTTRARTPSSCRSR